MNAVDHWIQDCCVRACPIDKPTLFAIAAVILVGWLCLRHYWRSGKKIFP